MRPLVLALVLAGLAAAAAEQINGSTAVYVFGYNVFGQLGGFRHHWGNPGIHNPPNIKINATCCRPLINTRRSNHFIF